MLSGDIMVSRVDGWCDNVSRLLADRRPRTQQSEANAIEKRIYEE